MVQLELPGKRRMLSAIITKWSRAFVIGFDPGASELHWSGMCLVLGFLPFPDWLILEGKAMSYLVLYQVWVCDRDWFRGLSFSPKWSMEIQTALKIFLKLFERALSWHDIS